MPEHLLSPATGSKNIAVKAAKYFRRFRHERIFYACYNLRPSILMSVQGFDPTNNLLADIHYVKAAHGADYSDCSPIKGVLKTTGGQKTSYGVKIRTQQMAASEQ
jgi:hypothetical protein